MLGYAYRTKNKSVIYSFVQKDFYYFSAEFLTIFLRCRKKNLKLNPLLCAFSGNCSAVKLHTLLCNGKSQSGSAALRASRGIQPVKLFKDPFQIFLGNCITEIDKLKV